MNINHQKSMEKTIEQKNIIYSLNLQAKIIGCNRFKGKINIPMENLVKNIC